MPRLAHQHRRAHGLSDITVIVILVLTALIIATGVVYAVARFSGPRVKHEREIPPVLKQAPDWTLTDQRGDRFGTEQLQGKISIQGFVFLQCNGVCPAMFMSLQSLENEIAQSPYADRIELVAISIDGENDTPEMLTQRMELMNLDPAITHFVTGPQDETWPLSNDGYDMLVQDNDSTDPNAMRFIHSDNLVLVDGDNQVRGYYKAGDPTLMRQMLADAETILMQQGQP